MMFKRLNRELAESMFMAIQNVEGSAMVANQAVQMDLSTSIDGVRSVQPNTAQLFAVQGVADAAIADQAFGLCQVYGYRSQSIVFQTGTSQAAGVPLVPTAGQNYLASVATTIASNTTITLQPLVAVLAEDVASSSASATISAKVFIKGLGV